MTSERVRFEELLPFYINGTLQPDDLAFMQDYLARHDHAADALALARHIQQTVQAIAGEQPSSDRVEGFLKKWAQTSPSTTPEPDTRKLSRIEGLRGWWIGLAGLGAAAMAVALMLIPGLSPVGALHWDQLDGRPDIEVVFLQNTMPDYASINRHLQRFNSQIVAQSERNGQYRMSIDLQNRAADQHELIKALQGDGGLQSYSLLASR